MKEIVVLIVIYYVTIINKITKNMKNKNKIILSFLMVSFMANSIFAFENTDTIREKVNKALGESKEVKAIIKKEVTKQVKEEVKKIKSKDYLESKKIIKDKKPEDIFFENIKNAKNEEERISIFTKFKKDIKEKPEFINNKIKNIFTKFDFILDKLNKVKSSIDKENLSLKERGLVFGILEEKNIEIEKHIDMAKKSKASAWINMENIDFSGEKEYIILSLNDVKLDLISSKNEIKKVSQLLKENIAFIKGALSTFKK